MSQCFSQDIVNAFQSVAQLKRSDVFQGSVKRPISAQAHADVAVPGWLGPKWVAGSDLLVGVNPGGGSDSYRINPTDNALYDATKQFALTEPGSSAATELSNLTEVYLHCQTTHQIRHLISAILLHTGKTHEESAFINIVPFRTRGNVEPNQSEKRNAWAAGVSLEVERLQAGRILALGKKAYDFLRGVPLHGEPQLIYLARTNGDHYVAAGAIKTIESL